MFSNQMKTEIEVLRRVGSSQHIIELYSYNLNGTFRTVILEVLEYPSGGELFDLLYCMDSSSPILARTYFKQLFNAIQCLHNHGVIHRDITSHNLLLDRNYNLKLTGFGVSKIIDLKSVKDSDLKNAKLIDAKVGTKGYQAPVIVEMNAKLMKGIINYVCI